MKLQLKTLMMTATLPPMVTRLWQDASVKKMAKKPNHIRHIRI